MVLKFNDRAVEDSRDLPRFVTSVSPRHPFRVQVWRDGKTVELRSPSMSTRTLPPVASVQSSTPGKKREPAKSDATSEGRLGLMLRPLTEKEREAAKLANGGAVVADLSDKSTAEARQRRHHRRRNPQRASQLR